MNAIETRIRDAFAGAHAGRVSAITTDDPERLVYDVLLHKPLPETHRLAAHKLDVLDTSADRLSVTVLVPVDWLTESAAAPEPSAAAEIPAEPVLLLDDKAALTSLYHRWSADSFPSDGGWSMASQIGGKEVTLNRLVALAERGLVERRIDDTSGTSEWRITSTGCTVIHRDYPPAGSATPSPIQAALEKLRGFDADRDPVQFRAALVDLWAVVQPLPTAPNPALEAEVKRLQDEQARLLALNDVQSRLLKGQVLDQPSGRRPIRVKTLQQEARLKTDWEALDVELAQLMSDGWTVVSETVNTVVATGSTPYLSLRLIRLERELDGNGSGRETASERRSASSIEHVEKPEPMPVEWIIPPTRMPVPVPN